VTSEIGVAAAIKERPETQRGRLLFGLLLTVHARIRSELEGIERLAAAVVNGLSADDFGHALEGLRSNSMLWQLQVSCLRYCRFVHSHHSAEDAEFFDELEETNPALGPVVEQLRADHRGVSDYLDRVDASAGALTADDSLDARRAVADALEALAAHLRAHLHFEERSVAATTRRLHDWKDDQ
jgi:Hemerythrin HHE cation binding domain